MNPALNPARPRIGSPARRNRLTGDVATTYRISPHSAAEMAAKMPQSQVSSGLTTKAGYVSAPAKDKAQYLPNGIMPANGPQAGLAAEKTAGKISGPVNLATTCTNSFAIKANKLEGFTK